MMGHMTLPIILCVLLTIFPRIQGAAPNPGRRSLPNPRIVEHPQDGFLARDQPATLNCQAKGTPKPVVTWYRNGQLVSTYPEDTTSHRMIIQDGKLFFLRVIHTKKEKPDVGIYYCNATNVHGSAISRNATLRIAVMRDDFRQSPSDVPAAVGDTAVFHCKPPVGKPEPKVLWRKGQEWIQGNSRIQVKDNGDLVISSVMVSDAGQYTCMAKNMAGEKASKPATLKVLEKPSFRKFPVDITTREAETVEFPCDVVGDQPLDVEWKKEGGFIAYGRMRTLRDHTLRIENVQASDAGVYICVAKNKVGTAEAVARLIVQFLPTFQVKPKDKVVGVGRTVTMQCSVMGIPPPTIIWSKQAREPTGEKTLMFPNFAEGRYSVASDGTLRIDRVQLTDSGKYECEALSGLGSAKATAILEVKESDPRPPPVIRFGPQNQTLPTNDNCLLHCEAVGDPVPTIRWFKNGNPLPIDPRILQLGSGTLQISDVQKSDGGTYTCKASSETGETTRSAVLQVEDPLGNKPFRRSQNVKSFPGPPSKPIIDDIKNTDVTLSWQPSGNHGDSDVFAYIVEYFSHETTEGWIVASDSVPRSPYTVTNLQPSTAYVFLVRAKNSNGIGAPSDLSDPVITADSTRIYNPDPQSVNPSSTKLSRQEIRRRMRGIVVDLKAVDSLPSAAHIIWRVYNDLDLIERFEIEYTEILDMSKSVLGRTVYQNVSKDVRSYTLKQLRSRQWYNICVRAYHGDLSTQCSSKFKVRPLDHVLVAPPRDFAVHKTNEKSVRLEWSPPVDMGRGNGPIRGYHIKCISTDNKHNCSRSVWGNITMVTIHELRPELTYSIKVAAKTSSGTGEWSKSIMFGPEQTSLMKEPWFIGVLIGVIGGTLWLALCVFSVWLCRKRRNKKKQKMQEMYSVPNFHTQKSDDAVRNSYSYYRNGYSQKDAQHGSTSMTPMAPEFANLLESKDTDGQTQYHDGQSPYNDGQNLYNVPQLKTFYYSKDPVAPYATTTLINAGTLPGRSGSGQDMNHVFRPIPQNSGSGDSCCKHECSGDSNTDNSRPNTGIPPDHNDMMQSPTSDSGSHTTDENGFLLKKGKKPLKQVIQPKQAMVNWAEFLPPPPEHPPPGGDTDIHHACPHYSSGNSSGSQQYAEINCLNRDANNRSPPMSPMSKISSCSCPVPQNTTPVSAYNMPAYSDTGCARCCSPKYCDNMTGPYGPPQYFGAMRGGAHSPRGQGPEWGHIRAQSPRGADYPHGNDTWGQRTIGCVNSRGTPVEVKCRSCHSDQEQDGRMTNFQSYKIIHPPNDFQHCQMHPRESEYQFLSDNERAGNRMCPCGTNIVGHKGPCEYQGQEGHCMDRACQSSLPSVASECIHSSLYKNRQEMGHSNQPMNIAVDGYHRNADSPVSDMGPEYAGESTETGETTDGDFPVVDKGQGHQDSNDVSAGGEPWATMTDQCNTEDSCDESESGNSSDGSFLNEADFASAVAKAAELSGLTVEGTTISDPKAKQQVRRQRRHHRPRPTSPYSTDSNFSEVVRKPYPKSQRKKQLAEQGGIRGSRKEQNAQLFQQRYQPPSGEEPPSYYKPNFPIQDHSKIKSKGPTLPPTSKDSGINMEASTKDYLRGTVKV